MKVTAVINTQAITEELRGTSLFMQSMSYEMKVCDLLFQEIIFNFSSSCTDISCAWDEVVFVQEG
jgi:hypothetical protein